MFKLYVKLNNKLINIRYIPYAQTPKLIASKGTCKEHDTDHQKPMSQAPTKVHK